MLYGTEDKHRDAIFMQRGASGQILNPDVLSPGKTTEERGFYIASVKTVEEFARGCRQHWGIKSTHWSLDVHAFAVASLGECIDITVFL